MKITKTVRMEKDKKFFRLFNLFNKMKLPAKSSLSFTAINFISKGAAFLFTPIFTRILTGAEYGEFSLFTSYLSLIIAIGSLELSGGVVIRAFQKYKDKTNITVLFATALTSAVILIITSIVFLIKSLTGGGMNFPFAYLFLTINALSTNIINICLSKYRFLYRWVPSLITSVTSSIISPLFSILFIKTANRININDISIKVGTMTFVLFICSASLLFITSRAAKKEKQALNFTRSDILSYGKEVLSLLFRLSLPMLPYYFSIMLISSVDKIMISRFISSEALGKYSVAYSAGIASTALTSGLSSALCPWIMRKVRAGDIKKAKKVLDTVISICISAIICFLSCAPYIFKILAPESYFDALPVIFISSIIPISLAIAHCTTSVAIAKEKVPTVFLCGAIPALFALVSGFIFIPSGNISVAAFITALAYIFSALFGILNIKRLTGLFIINPVLSFVKLLLFAFTSTSLLIFKEYIGLRVTVFLISAVFLLLTAKNSLSFIKE